MLPDPCARAEYIEAFRTLAARVAATLDTVPPADLPMKMFVAGGAAHGDSIALSLAGIDARVLDVRLLAPLDLAVSKISRFSQQDRADIASLARHQNICSTALRRRAHEALAGYVGSIERVRGSIELACRIVEDMERRRSA